MKKIFNAILSLLMFVAGGITSVCGLTLFFWGRARIDHVFAYVLTCTDVGPSLKFAFGLWIALGAILFAIACKYYKKFALVAPIIAITMFVYTFKAVDYWLGADDVSTLYEDEYKTFDAPSAEAPKRNLIVLFLESMESDYRDYDGNGGNLLPELSEIADENHFFKNFNQLKYTKATILGQASALCGLAYKFEFKNYNLQNLLDNTLPNAVCISDVLAKNGYNTYFLKGASLDFAMTGKFMAQHGFSELQGWHELSGHTKGNDWGVKDSELYGVFKQKITWLAAQKKPFLAVMTTLDMHYPNEYLDTQCNKQFGDRRDIVKCADKMASDFVRWMQKQDFYANTTIVVMGDHVFLDKNDIYPDKKERQIFNAVINPVEGLSEKKHLWTTLDMAPTIMEAIGFEAPAFGLGRSLWRSEQTLFEKYGKNLDLEFMKSSDFYKNLNGAEKNIELAFEDLPIGTTLVGNQIKPYATSLVKTKDNVFGAVWSGGLNFAVGNENGLCLKAKFLLIKNKSDEKVEIMLNGKKIDEWEFAQFENAPFEREICLGKKDIPTDGKIALKFVRKIESVNPFSYALGWQSVSTRIWTNTK